MLVADGNAWPALFVTFPSASICRSKQSWFIGESTTYLILTLIVLIETGFSSRWRQNLGLL